MNEVNIIGGGLAGLSLALGLRRQGVPVTVHEAGNYPRHRVCGEFILGVSDADLEALDLTQPLADSPRHVEAAWFCGNESIGSRLLPMAARAISRFRLDERLAERARAAGARVICGTRLTAKPETGWVQASGRVRAKEGKWLGLKAHYEGLRLQGGLEMHLGRGGYVGLTAVENGRVNVCALLPAGGGGEKATLLPRRLREIGLTEVAERLESARVDVDSVTGVSHFDLGFQPMAEPTGTIALGDGHSMIPPFTGAGMSMAFEASARALPHLVNWAEGRMEWSETSRLVRQVLRQHFVSRMRWAAVVHRMLLSPVGPWLLKAGVGWKCLPFNSLVRALRGA